MPFDWPGSVAAVRVVSHAIEVLSPYEDPRESLSLTKIAGILTEYVQNPFEELFSIATKTRRTEMYSLIYSTRENIANLVSKAFMEWDENKGHFEEDIADNLVFETLVLLEGLQEDLIRRRNSQALHKHPKRRPGQTQQGK